ncbi:MAG: hypothetical protein P4L50_06940 [Anaerolineaceae bacterium]|nr:hypothetical protein [Anaerolineaceae bacterium]
MGRFFAPITALIACLAAGCSFASEKSKIDEADIRLVSAEPLESKARRLIGNERVVQPNEVDAVSEKIAQSLISQLGDWGAKGKELANSLLECSAIHAANMQGNKSTCFDNYSGEAKEGCLVKHGVGRKSVGQILTADRFDLNADGIGDYIISDRYYCSSLSANQSSVYFVLLSRAKGDFHLAYAGWASYGLDVAKDPANGSNVLIERTPKTYGMYSRVMQLVNEKYVPRICVVQDSDGYSRCDKD